MITPYDVTNASLRPRSKENRMISRENPRLTSFGKPAIETVPFPHQPGNHDTHPIPFQSFETRLPENPFPKRPRTERIPEWLRLLRKKNTREVPSRFHERTCWIAQTPSRRHHTSDTDRGAPHAHHHPDTKSPEPNRLSRRKRTMSPIVTIPINSS